MLISDKKPYTHVRLICEDDGNLNQRYEIRVSTFVQFDEVAGRRSITNVPSKEQALLIAKEIARREKIRTGSGWNFTKDARWSRIRLQVEQFDTIEAIDPELRGIIERNWPHLAPKLPPEDDIFE